MTTPLIPIRHDLLSAVTHGFFTRVGGASSGIFEGLNCGLGSSDQAEVVQINRTRVRETVGADFLQTVHQHHSSYAVVVTNPIAPVPKADAMVTKTKGIALGIMTADCEPILFADTDAGVVGAAHAGWKGARTGVIESTLDAMETLGAARNNIVAVIGPCISQSAYEVGPEFFDEITYDDPDASSFFAQGKDDRYMFDLPS
ncbi:MAG: polyphenol oxidase family protein, partial [Planktomarina sp.]